MIGRRDLTHLPPPTPIPRNIDSCQVRNTLDVMAANERPAGSCGTQPRTAIGWPRLDLI